MTAVASTKSRPEEKISSFPKMSKSKALIAKSLGSSSKNYLLSDFLPYLLAEKIHSKLSVGLKEYRMLLIAADQSMTLYLQGNLSSFDSLVGENSCQIRSTMISLITDFPDLDIKNILDEIREKINKIDNFTSIRNKPCPQTLEDFIKKNQLHIKLNLREAFLISSFILTKVRDLLPPSPSKQIVRNERTDTKKVKKISPVGSTFARELVKKLRHFVSTASVTFVQETASLLPIPKSFINMVSEKNCVNHDKFGRLKCLPCFWYTFVLMQHSLASELPLILTINQIASDKDHKIIGELQLYFRVVNGKYELTSRNELPEDAPSLVILGSSCRKFADFPRFDIWRKEILDYNPRDLILAYAAAHRQYPDESKDVLVNDSNCEAFNYYRSKAHELGCSLDNPSLFFLVHAYCEKIKNVKMNDHNAHGYLNALSKNVVA